MPPDSKHNGYIIIASHWLTKLADALASAKTTLPWLLASLGAPAFYQGLLVPIRESGSLLPQLLLGHWIKRFALRKYIFAIGCAMQASCIAAIAIGALFLQGSLAGVWVVAWLALFSLARAFCSITSKDVLGKVIDKNERGKLTGLSATLAGCISIAIGALLLLPNFREHTAILLWLGAASWLGAALLYQRLDEPRSDTENEPLHLKELTQLSIRCFKNASFRQFILVRSLLMSSALTLPFIVILANKHNIFGLGGFIIASGIASLVSGRLWGSFADSNCKAQLIACAASTTVICSVAIIAVTLFQTPPFWLSLLLFFALAVTHEGVRIGRKIYVVNLAEGNQRTDYVALGNTFIGVLLLVVGIISAVLANIHLVFAFGAFALAAAGACWQALKLDRV